MSMTTKTRSEWQNNEKEFLHVLSGSLAGAMFVAELLCEDLKSPNFRREEFAENLEKMRLSLEKAKSILESRKKLLKAKPAGSDSS